MILRIKRNIKVFSVSCILFILFMVFFSTLCVKHHVSFFTSYDLALFENLIWNFTNGNGYITSLGWDGREHSYFANHFNWTYPLLYGLPYLIFPRTETLLFLQTFFLGLTFLPLFLIFNKPSYLCSIIQITFFLYVPIYWVGKFDFHPETAFIFLFLLSVYFYRTKKTGLFFIFYLLALGCKEEVSLVFLMFSIVEIFSKLKRMRIFNIHGYLNSILGSVRMLKYAVSFGKNEMFNSKSAKVKLSTLRLPCAIFLFSLFYFCLSLVVIYLSADGQFIHLTRYSLNSLLIPPTFFFFLTFLLLVSPLLFLPLMNVYGFLMLPYIILTFTSKYPDQHTPFNHYPFSIIPVLLYAYGLTLRKIFRVISRNDFSFLSYKSHSRYIYFGGIFVIQMIFFVLYGPFSGKLSFSKKFSKQNPEYSKYSKDLQNAKKFQYSIASDVSFLLPHLSQRRVLLLYDPSKQYSDEVLILKNR